MLYLLDSWPLRPGEVCVRELSSLVTRWSGGLATATKQIWIRFRNWSKYMWLLKNIIVVNFSHENTKIAIKIQKSGACVARSSYSWRFVTGKKLRKSRHFFRGIRQWHYSHRKYIFFNLSSSLIVSRELYLASGRQTNVFYTDALCQLYMLFGVKLCENNHVARIWDYCEGYGTIPASIWRVYVARTSFESSTSRI